MNLPRVRNRAAISHYVTTEGGKAWDRDENPLDRELKEDVDISTYSVHDVSFDKKKEQRRIYDDLGPIQAQNYRDRIFKRINDPGRIESMRVDVIKSTRKDPVENFLNSVGSKILERLKGVPTCILRALYRFLDRENFEYILERAEAAKTLLYELAKSKSGWGKYIEDAFVDISENRFRNFTKELQDARRLGAYNPEDYEILNPHGLTPPVAPIKPGETSEDHEKKLENEIFNQATDFCIRFMGKKVKEYAAEEELLKQKYCQPKPEAGFMMIKQYRQSTKSARFRDKRTVISTRLKEDQDPGTIFDVDPDSLYENPQPKQSFDELLPKRQRERVFRMLGKEMVSQAESS